MLRFTPSLIEQSTRDRNEKCFWRVEHGRHVRLTASLPSVSQSGQCGILNISQPDKPSWPVMEIDLATETFKGNWNVLLYFETCFQV
jgi:hypothetical protein